MNGLAQPVQAPVLSQGQSNPANTLGQGHTSTQQLPQNPPLQNERQSINVEQQQGAQLGADTQLVQVRGQALGIYEGETMIAATSTPLPVSASSISSASQAVGVEDPLSRGAQNGSPAGFQDSALPLDIVQEPIIVVAHDRRVRMSSEMDPHSLYSFCRKWVQNRPAEDEELGFAPPIPSVLPKPLPAQQPGPETDATEAHDTVESYTGVNSEGIAPSKLTPKELLRAHVQAFKLVRKRKREEWRQRVKRYKPRLCLIFPPGAAAVADKKDETKADPEKQTQ